ncbi:MAG TPA: SDR family NAD(P)-dependent oxidoreductase, partial [Rubrobacter sp.]|nr:SDR family NAD(P)-dependent oxidoreductase [Rubrobacter sp.]
MQVGESTFFITGGGSGLGAATARLLVENGAHVALADVDEEAGELMASQIGSGAEFVRTDVTDEESVQDALDSVVEM